MQAILSGIIIFCTDVKKLTGFYEKHFGLTIAEDISEDWAVLKSGNLELAFHKIGEEYRESSDENFVVYSNTKLVFEITEGFEGLREKILEDNVELGEPRTFAGINGIFCDGKDPEGNVFQLKFRPY